jgi:hypothetical protein
MWLSFSELIFNKRYMVVRRSHHLTIPAQITRRTFPLQTLCVTTLYIETFRERQLIMAAGVYISRWLLCGCCLALALACYSYSVDLMKPFRPLPGLLGFTASLGAPSVVSGQFNAPPGVDTWCGKAYRAT